MSDITKRLAENNEILQKLLDELTDFREFLDLPPMEDLFPGAKRVITELRERVEELV